MPVLLTALAASGFQRITYEADPEYLFSPINGPSKAERQALEKHFPMNYSDFDAGQCKNVTQQAFSLKKWSLFNFFWNCKELFTVIVTAY